MIFWFSEEVRYADIYMNMLSSNNFFSLTLNGHPYAETGPLYFILVWLLDAIPTINMPQAFFGSSILFAMLFVASTWILARGLGYSNKIAFTAGLILLSTFFLAGFTNYTRMDLLFAAFLNLSYVCFFRAWNKKIRTDLAYFRIPFPLLRSPYFNTDGIHPSIDRFFLFLHLDRKIQTYQQRRRHYRIFAGNPHYFRMVFLFISSRRRRIYQFDF